MINCPYCDSRFKHNGIAYDDDRPFNPEEELQKCPGCGSKLLIGPKDLE